MGEARVGAFGFDAALGRGGMGRVFSGRHVASGARVVLKVPREGASADARRLFAAEAGILARLDDPGLVRIHDYGALEEDVRVGAHTLGAGTPFVVMEHVGGEPLDGERVQGAFGGDVAQATRAILEPLAVTHGEGVLHLDLKPANILIGADGRVCLIDFGLASTLEGDALGGTRAYMAPEQHDHAGGYGIGPWTDLFALGCVVFEWLTGRVPFVGAGALDVLEHKREGLDARSLLDAPERWRPWLTWALATAPGARFASAAEALAMLPTEGASDSTAAPRDVATSSFWESSSLLDAPRDTLTHTTTSPAHARARTTLPERYDERRRGERRELSGAGLGLVALRSVGMVGREPLRRMLWDAARERRAVWLHGEAGVGKSHAARWLASQVRRHGGAVFSVAPAGGALVEALGRALASWAGATRLDDAACRVRATARLTTGLGLALERAAQVCELIRPSRGVDLTEKEAAERFAWVLEACSTRRPCLLIIEAPDEHPHTTLDALARTPGWGVLVLSRRAPPSHWSGESRALGPLGREEHRELMGRVLDLDDALAGDLFERTRGNPLFSLEFVRWWADRGALTSSALGFAVSREGADEVPTSVMDVARERAAKALGHPERRRLALTLATLADPLDPQELGALMGADAEERAQRLSELALLEPTRQGWRFDYATLREALLEMRDAEETRDANIACADALRSLERFGEAHWRRILDHELAAGRPEVALEDAREYIPSTHPRQSRALLRHLESRLEGSRETRGIIALYDAWVAKIEGDMDAMHAHLAHVRSVGPSDDVLERADVLELAYLIDASDYEAAEEKARAFAARLEGQDGKLARLATCLETLADALIYQGRPDEAVPVIERTLEIYTGDSPARDLQQAGWAHYNMANAHEEASRYDLALEHCERAQAIFEPFGDDSGVGSCELMRGHIWTSHGNLEDATQAHARALELMERCGDGMFVYALFGLARCWLERARLDEARAVLDRLDTLRGENDFVEGTRDLEVWCAALEGDQARAIALLREEGAAWSEGAGEHLARARAVSRTRGMSALAQALDEHMERLDEGQ